MRHSLLALLFSAAVGLALPLPALADAALDAKWNAAYDAVLKNPGDTALNRQYLDLSIEREDYEAAIPPIERMLAKEPNNVGLIFKLGQMYQKLHSDKVAQGYFKQVATHPKASVEMRAAASALIKH